jgi:hypothetical protein
VAGDFASLLVSLVHNCVDFFRGVGGLTTLPSLVKRKS